MKQNKIPRNEYIRKPVGKTNPYKHDVLYTNLGQWKYPGQVTRIPSNDITMQGVDYPVYGEDDLGYGQMMYPGMDYTFPGQYVTEIPMAQKGRQQVEDRDSWLENIAEVFDPTGISSWDDVYRAYKNTGLSGETALEAFGAIPLLGKIGKSGKIITGGFGLLQDAVKASKYLPASKQQKFIDKAFDMYQKYNKAGGKELDEALGATTKVLRDKIPYINPNKWSSSDKAINIANKSFKAGRLSDAVQATLGAKDDSGFTWDIRHGEVPKYGGRNIFPQIELGEHGDFAYGGIPMAQKGYNIVPNVEYVKGMGSQYDPIMETIYIDSEDPEDPEKLLQHEMWHHYQNYNNYLRLPEDFPTRKRPQTPSTGEAFQEYYNRKKDDVEQLSRGFRERYPEFKFVPNQVLYDRAIDGIQYDQPWAMEGEGRAAESPEGIEFLRDQGYDIDQYREMLEKAKNKKAYGGDPSLPNIEGHYQKGGAQTPEEWEKQIRAVENKIGDPSTWTLDSYKILQDKLNEYKTWRENTPEGKAVIDYHNEPNEYIIPLPSHLQTVPKKPFGGQNTKTHTHMKEGGWLDQYQKKGEVPAYKPKTKEEYDFRKKMYNDSLSLANMSRKAEWIFPQNPSISKEEFQRLRELEKTYPQYGFAREQYDIDQKKGKTRDFKDYVTSYNIYSKDRQKSITGYDISEGEKEIDKKYEEASKYKKSWVDKQGRKHNFEPDDLKGNSGVESIYDPQTGTQVDRYVDYKYPETNFNLDISNKYIKPTETEYKGSKNKKEHGKIALSSKSTGWYDSTKPKPKFKNTSNDEYITYDHETEIRNLYPYPKQKILKPDPNAPQGEKMTMESYINNINTPIERIIPRTPVFTNEPQELRQSLPINIPQQVVPSKTADKDFLRIFVNPAPERIPDPKSKKVKHLVSPPLKHGGWLDQYAEGGDDSAKKDPGTKTKRNFKIVDDPDDPAYKDFLIRKGLYEHSTIPNIHLRNESSWRLNDQQPFDMADFKEDYDVDRIKRNKSFTDESYGPHGSEVNQRSYTPEEFNRLLKRQAVSADEYDKDLVKKYPPASYQLLETYTDRPYDIYYATNNDRTKYIKPTTKVIEDKIDRKALKEIYPDLTDKNINNYLKNINQSPDFITNVMDASGNRAYVYDFEKKYTDADRPETYTSEGLIGYLPEEIQTGIKKDKYYLPVYNKPEDEYFLRKGNIDYLEPGKAELQDMNVEDAPFNLNFKKPIDYKKRQWDFNSPMGRTMRYYDEANKLLYSDIMSNGKVQRFYESDYEREKTPMDIPYAEWEKMLQNKEEGGSIGGDEFRRGGMYYGTPSKLKKKAKKYGTSKNIQSSINKLFTRNYDVFGPGGKNIYNPNVYKTGGWLDNLD